MPSSALQNYHCHYFSFLLFNSKQFFPPSRGRGSPGHSEGWTLPRPCPRSPAAGHRGSAATLSPDAAAARRLARLPLADPGPAPAALAGEGAPWWPQPRALRPTARRAPAAPRCPGERSPRGARRWRRRFREQGFQIQVSFSPEPYARYLRYPCEWRRKTKTQQSLSQMPVLLNIKRL